MDLDLHVHFYLSDLVLICYESYILSLSRNHNEWNYLVLIRVVITSLGSSKVSDYNDGTLQFGNGCGSCFVFMPHTKLPPIFTT